MYKRIITTFLFLSMYLIGYNYIYGESFNIVEKTAVIMDADGSSILFNKNGDKKIYPASTTKILTAILAIESLDINSNITVSSKAISSVPTGSSIMYLKPGETLTVKQLLYGLLLPSGSDAANVLAEAVSGSIPNFVILMNKKLQEIGCTNSHFTNPHGFHDKEHYSTAYDMALLMSYASKNETFRDICETKVYSVPPTNKVSTVRKLESTDLLLSNKLDYVLGGKTGYTEEAGNVFVCYSKLDGKNIICSLFDGSKDIDDKSTRFKDTELLLDKCFKEFDKNKIIDKNDLHIEYIDRKTNKSYTLGIDDDIYCLSDKDEYIINYTLSDVSFNDGNVSGEITITSGNENWQLNKTYKLKLINEKIFIDKDTLYNMSNNMKLIILLILFMLIIILRSIKKNNIKKRKLTNRNKY